MTTIQATTLFEAVKQAPESTRWIGKWRDNKINWAAYDNEKDCKKYKHHYLAIFEIKPNLNWYRIKTYSSSSYGGLDGVADFQAQNDAEAILKTKKRLKANIKNYKELSKKHFLKNLDTHKGLDFSLTKNKLKMLIRKLEISVLRSVPYDGHHSIFSTTEDINEKIDYYRNLLNQFNVLEV